jgi:uncharacterized protein (DUF362 family)
LKGELIFWGEFSQFAGNGTKRILLKPNVLWGVDPQNCVTTHPSIFRAVAKVFKAVGADLFYATHPQESLRCASLKKSGLSEVASELKM